MQLNLTILTKQKKTTRYYELYMVAKALSTHVSNDLTQVSVPVKDGSQ
jgi:hypothetical protein